MTITLHIPKKRNTLITRDGFKKGRLYRCVEFNEHYSEWKGCVAWVAEKSNLELGIAVGDVCAIHMGSSGYKFNKNLYFSTSYKFEELPVGSTIKFVTTKIETIETEHTVTIPK